MGKEQPIGLLLVNQPVLMAHRLDPDMVKDCAKCIGKG